MNMPTTSLIAPKDVVNSYPPHDYTVTGLFASRAAAQPTKQLLAYEGKAWTYEQVARDVEVAACWLISQEIQAGDRVGVFSANHPSTVILFLALARIGAIMVPVNPDFGVAEARYVFMNAQVRGIVCSPANHSLARQALEGVAPAPWIIVNEPGDAGIPVLHDALGATQVFDLPAPPTADATCVFIYSSGTTGAPKWAMHGQRGYVITAESFVVRLFLQPDDRILCVLPLFHINALFYSLGGALAAGATLVLAPRFSASGFWKTVVETKASTVNLIGAAASILTKRDRSEFIKGHALKKAFVAPLNKNLVDTFRDEFDIENLIECYGMTEIPGVLSNPFLGLRKLGSMGKVSPHLAPALPQAELRIVDDRFHDVPVGAEGQLLVRTPTIMQGYYADTERTAAAFHEGWFITGDIARRDHDDFYWFVARQKDIIRCRGENISGAELDRVIAEHPGVLEAAVIGVPASLGEEDVLAVVVQKEGVCLTAKDIADWVKSQVAAIKIPAYVVFAESIPKTATHRVEKYKLKADKQLLAGAAATYAAR